MTIPAFIEKAIGGGWVPNWPPRLWSNGIADIRVSSQIRIAFYRKDGSVGTKYWHVADFYPTLLDPSAWKAVGKVEGWGQPLAIGSEVEFGPTPLSGIITSFDKKSVRIRVEGLGLQKVAPYTVRGREWKRYMHRMIDALAEGKTIEQYLESL